MDTISEFRKVKLSLDNVSIPSERLRNTPSRKDGCPHDLEVDLRIVTCEYIQTAGLLLRLPQVAMATAQILFHRFFYSKSFIKYNMVYVAMACIFLAAKIEENCRRVRDVANVFHHLKQKRMGRPVVPMEYMGEEYFKLKASIIKYERFILKELGFCVHIQHPHKLIIAYLQILELEKNTRLAQKSWNYMNDSLRTNVFVRFSPVAIACACIFLSARQLRIALPQKPPWWTIFDVGFEDIEAVSLEILALYKRPRVFMLDLEKKLNAIKEVFSKKQIEIREVDLKKVSSGKRTSANDAPCITLSPAAAAEERKGNVGKGKSSSDSPAVPFPTHSKLQPSPLSQSVSHKDSPHAISNSTSPNPPITNGSKRKDNLSPIAESNPLPRTSSPSSCPPASKRRKLSSSPEGASSRTRGRSAESRVKPVISPIHFGNDRPIRAPIHVGSGDSNSEASGSSLRENGVVPKQYRGDYSKHRSHSKHHRHRRHHHHSSTTGGGTKSRLQEHHHQQRGEEGRNSRRGDQQHQSTKRRRTELERYR